jgi:hypothetical protein
LPQDPASDPLVCADCWNFAQLFQVHRARADRKWPGRRGVIPPDGNAADYLHAEVQRDMKRLEVAGYKYLDPDANAYRMTIKGAYIMTWRLLWPLKPMRFAARRRKADRELKELGFGSLAEFRAKQGTLPPMALMRPGFDVLPPEELRGA